MQGAMLPNGPLDHRSEQARAEIVCKQTNRVPKSWWPVTTRLHSRGWSSVMYSSDVLSEPSCHRPYSNNPLKVSPQRHGSAPRLNPAVRRARFTTGRTAAANPPKCKHARRPQPPHVHNS